MKIYPRLFAKLFCQPILLHEPVRTSLERALLSRMDLVPVAPPDNPEEPEDPQQPDTWRVSRVYQAIGDTAIVSITGIIDKHISAFDMECYGGCDLNDIDGALALADRDPVIKRVVLYINSPGGSEIGVPETAARVADMRSRKEVLARVDSFACSAAYWIASQADRIDASESTYLGSIGVYCAILDATRALEIDGFKMELISAGKFKTMGSPFKTLTPEERAIFQAKADDLYTRFKAAVRSGRGTVGAKMSETISDDVMQGQCFRGQKAIDAGLADELINATLDEYITALLTGVL
jgi:protease-4